MNKKTTVLNAASTVCYETLESFARFEIQHWLQDLLEAEVTEFLGRARHARGGRRGYRNGYAKPRRLALTAGTMTVRRPRLRNTVEAFQSRVPWGSKPFHEGFDEKGAQVHEDAPAQSLNKSAIGTQKQSRRLGETVNRAIPNGTTLRILPQ